MGLLSLALVAMILTGCGPRVSTPTLTPTQTATVPAPIAAMITWLQERQMGCRQTADTEWICGHDAAAGLASALDHTILTVTMEMRGTEIGKVVASLDATANPVPLASVICTVPCDLTTGFFADSISLSPVTGDQGQAIGSWVAAHGQTGGRMSFGRILVTLTAPAPVITMTLMVTR